MKCMYLVSLVFAMSLPVFAGEKVIYGEDNRKDVFESTDALHLKLARSTAAMVHLSHFEKGKVSRTYQLSNVPTLRASGNVCSTEKFATQYTAATCTGFLVGPDTLITAGHCYDFDLNQNKACDEFAWVFEYDMKSPTHNPNLNIPVENIYTCKQIFATQLDNLYDFAVIKLDRKVQGRERLDYRTYGKTPDKTPLVVIGHPSGLPTKIADEGKIINNKRHNYFVTNLDTFHGNSGSPVFNSLTGLVEGILVQGKNDYVPKTSGIKSCVVVNKCDNNGKNCSDGNLSDSIEGEVVFRMEKIAAIIAKAFK